jgi:hypothetical protein
VVDLQNFINYWDQHVSTWHPDISCPPAAIHPSARLFSTLEDTKLELAEMLNHLQRHRQCLAGYCERHKKDTEETFCRFGFPKECRDGSTYAKEPTQDFAELHTRRNDPIINSYNPGFILGWRANIDFRPVINKEAVIAYVAKYASKGETSSTTYNKSLQTAISHMQDTDAAGIAYQKMLSSFVAERDISGQETCHILLGCKLIHSSWQTRSLCVSPDASEHLDFEHSNSRRVGLIEHYKQRPGNPHPAANITLLDFATNWDWKASRIVRCGVRGAK